MKDMYTLKQDKCGLSESQMCTFTKKRLTWILFSAPPREEFFLIADATYGFIYKQNRLGDNYERIPISFIQRPVAVDYDPVESKVYYTDVVAQFIARINLDGTEEEIIISANVVGKYLVLVWWVGTDGGMGSARPLPTIANGNYHAT